MCVCVCVGCCKQKKKIKWLRKDKKKKKELKKRMQSTRDITAFRTSCQCCDLDSTSSPLRNNLVFSCQMWYNIVVLLSNILFISQGIVIVIFVAKKKEQKINKMKRKRHKTFGDVFSNRL